MNPRPCPTCRRPLDAHGTCAQCGRKTVSQSQTVPTGGHTQGASAPGPVTGLPAKLGPYAVLRELGRGGMGRVLEAVDEPLGRHVAVKLLLSPSAASAQNSSRRRFVEEARITGCLEHPGIAPIYSLGRAPDGSEYFSMKLVAGRTLNDVLKDRDAGNQDILRKYPLARLLSIFERVVETVAYAHAQNVLHRDLKPANIMVGAHGEVWVLDWGLAKIIGKDDPTAPPMPVPAPPPGRPAAGDMTEAGSLIGTPQYMAPEQARSQPLDARTDVFGLGGVLYRMLTGGPPNQGVDYMGTLMAAAVGEVPAVRSTSAGRRAPAKLAAIADKCLAGKPENRYASAELLLADLRAYAAGEAVKAAPDGVGGVLLRLIRRHHRAAIALGLMATVLLVGWTLAATALAARDRQALELERTAQAAEQARQATVAESAARSQRRMKAFTPYAEATDLLMRAQLPDQAATKLEESLRIDPEFPEAQFALGEALRLAGTPGKAAEAYLKANELSKQIAGRPHLQALLAAGMAYDGAGDYVLSEKCFAQADQEGAGHPLALVGKSFRLAHDRKFVQARATAEEAQRKAPHYWETHFACGYVLEEMANMGYVAPEPTRTQAIAALRRSLELSPRQAETWVWLAHALNRTNILEKRIEAQRLYDHAVALEPRNGNRYVSRAINRLNNGQVESGLADLQKAKELNAARPLVLLADAAVAAQRRDYTTAYQHMTELLQVSREWPSHMVNWYALGFQTGKADRARFDEWCKRNADYPEVAALRGQLKARESDFPGAVVEDRVGLKFAPYNRKLLYQVALHFQLGKQWQDALTAADAGLAVVPNEFALQAIRTRCLVEVGRGADAKTALDQLTKDFPTRSKDIEDLRRAVGDRLPK